MSFIPPQRPQMEAEYAKARANEIQERALHYSERHPEADHPLETRSEHLLRRLFAAIRGKGASEE